MKILSFGLTMPNVGSWNGRWSGASKHYYKHQTVKDGTAMAILDGKDSRNFHYSFGDGWGANVRVEVVTAPERRRRDKISAGFCGYEWMIESIVRWHGIYRDQEHYDQAMAKRVEQALVAAQKQLAEPSTEL